MFNIVGRQYSFRIAENGGMTFPADGTALAFFGAEETAPIHGLCFNSVESIIDEESHYFFVKYAKHCWGKCACGIRRAQSFLLCNRLLD